MGVEESLPSAALVAAFRNKITSASYGLLTITKITPFACSTAECNTSAKMILRFWAIKVNISGRALKAEVAPHFCIIGVVKRPETGNM